MRRVLSAGKILVAVVAALGLGTVGMVARAEPAVMYDMGGKFDKSFNEAAYAGAKRFKSETGTDFREFEPTNETQRLQAMRRLAMPYVPSRGSLFCWVDLSELLEEDSTEGELALWRAIFEETGVLLTPGVGFGHSKHGLFRVVYPCVQIDELRVAMTRLERYVRERRARVGG